jgi:hypothetical protein
MNNLQYYDSNELEQVTPQIDFRVVELISTDSYSDKDIWDSIKKTGEEKLLAICAVQTSIIGLGNKTYGTFKYQGKEHTVNDLYKSKGIKTDSTLGSKLSPGDLTPRRLNRAFRLIIRKYLEHSDSISSYLWRKYTPRDPKYRTVCYPGSEHLVDNNGDALYIYNAYKELDVKQKTDISNRILRVFNARGLLLEVA